MNYEKAKQIVAERFPEMIVDPLNPSLPDMLVLRKTKNGAPFSIHLSHVDPSTLTPIEAQDAQAEQQYQPGIDGHPGQPWKPARPAIPGQTVEQQREEKEVAAFVASLDHAMRHFGFVASLDPAMRHFGG